MLLAERNGTSLLYTGDFRPGPSLTAEAAELPRADILVMECTFGHPQYRFPPRGQAAARLIELVRECFHDQVTPVVHAYAVGKAQEVTRLLTDAGIPVLQHRRIFEISGIYRRCGVELGEYGCYEDRPLPGHAVVTPPSIHRGSSLSGIEHRRTIAVTGWAHLTGGVRRWRADEAVALSDHADYDELLAAVGHVSPQEVYCTHGPESFVDCLRQHGWNAMPLARARHRRSSTGC